MKQAFEIEKYQNYYQLFVLEYSNKNKKSFQNDSLKDKREETLKPSASRTKILV